MKITSSPPALDATPNTKPSNLGKPPSLEKIGDKKALFSQTSGEDNHPDTVEPRISSTESGKVYTPKDLSSEKSVDARNTVCFVMKQDTPIQTNNQAPSFKPLYSSESVEDLGDLSSKINVNLKREVNYVDDDGTFVQRFPFKRGGGPLPKIKRKG